MLTNVNEVKEVKKEVPEVAEEKKILSAEELTIGNAKVEEIKKTDAEQLAVATEELRGFNKEQGEEKNILSAEELISLASQKLDEMQKLVDSKKGFLRRTFINGDKDYTNAEGAIIQARKKIASGKLPDMIMVKNSTMKFALDVDVSMFPTEKGRNQSIGNSPANL
ncbi:MAG: hypothetical protein WCT09_04200 [Patescibacteria group bacterium]